MSLLGGQARRLRAALMEAPDQVVGRVVAMLDSLENRGVVDSLLSEVRPRLRRLQPPRPLRFTRLLFLPLEGALVPPAEWRPGHWQVPRGAILPLTRAVRAALGEATEALEVAALGRSMTDQGAVLALGSRLWPAAGAAVLALPPPGWSEAGLPAASAAPIAALCAAVWRHAAPLWQATATLEEEPSETALRMLLTALAAEGIGPLTAGLALLLRRSLRPGLVAGLAVSLNPGLQAVAEKQLAALLARDAARVAKAESPAEMAEAAALFGRRLEDLEICGQGVAREVWRRHGVALRSQVGAACHGRFAAVAEAALLGPASAAAVAPAASDEAVAALEEAARDLRRLEAAGRRLGQEAAFDRSLRELMVALAQLAGLPGGGGLTAVELARLAEILAGAEAAQALLDPPGAR